MYTPEFRTNKEKVPILSKNEIEKISENFIYDFCPGVLSNPHPVDIEMFIENYLGLAFDYHSLSSDKTVLGMTVFCDTNQIIIYNNESKKSLIPVKKGTIIIEQSLTDPKQNGRFRFTCAHEAAHWIFHKYFYLYHSKQPRLFDVEDYYVQCKDISKSLSKVTKSFKTSHEWMEWHADYFASCFMFPKKAIEKLVGTPYENTYDFNSLIDKVSNTFEMSKEATFWRLKNLGYLDSFKNKNELSLF